MRISKSFSSVKGRTALHRLHFPVMNEFLAVHILQSRGFNRIGAPLPAQARDLVGRADMRRRITVAIETETHAQRLFMADFIHLIQTSWTCHTLDAAGD